MSGVWVGTRVQRKEDRRFLTGRGRFTDDVPTSHALYLAFTRSPVAFGSVDRIDVDQANGVEGVRGAFTAVDLGRPGLTAALDREEYVRTTMPLLADDTVRFVGEPVVAVVADDPYAAEDGADAVQLQITERTPVMTVADALGGGGPVHPAAADGVLIDLPMFIDPQIERELDRAAVVVRKTFSSARLSASPLEARTALAEWNNRDEQLVLHLSTQIPHQVRSAVAEVMGLPERSVRVIAPDVGGGFGLKCVVGREELVAAILARRLRRPVRWTEDRRDSLTASFHGHEQQYSIRAGFGEDGKLLALDADVLCDVGAYSVYPFTCGVEPLMAASELPGVYKIPRYAARARAVATNKPPTAPYRGVSRPQIVLVMERVMDSAARRLGIDPIELRLRNIIQPEDFPYTGINGITYELGSYRESLELAAAKVTEAGWRNLPAGKGIRRGVGIACFCERSAYGTETMGQRRMAMTPGYDVAHIRMDPSGEVTVTVGTCGHGQGHETTFAQIVADQLGITPDQISLREGDTDLSSYGWGTWGSRSLVIGGGAAHVAAGRLAERLRKIAANMLEVDAADVELSGGAARVRGTTDASLTLREIAQAVHWQAQRLPDNDEYLLEARGEFDPPGGFSNSVHAALVEIDTGTGDARVVDYIVVEDCGVVVNPTIVEGQVTGGVAQGIASALYERLVFDPQGQPLSGTFMDYLVPTAHEIPRLTIYHLETPWPESATGSKGMGEGGAIGAPAAVLCAVNDALAGFGIDLDTIPVTPEMILDTLSQPASAGTR